MDNRIISALNIAELIKEGYPYKFRWGSIKVANPAYEKGNGESPYLVSDPIRVIEAIVEAYEDDITDLSIELSYSEGCIDHDD